jgi:Carboxypeptidase regulatory-like domain
VSVLRKAGRLTGWVKDEKGNPVPAATVHVAGLSKVTDSSGYFEFSIPGRMQGELDLQALAPGHAPVNFSSVVPDANPLTIQLKRSP